MGCISSLCQDEKSSEVTDLVPAEPMGSAEKSIKAALLIQQWYRRCRARLEVRRRCSWSIFQSLEYAGEQNQIKLYGFFNELIRHYPASKESKGSSVRSSIEHSLRSRSKDQADQEEAELWKATNPELVPIEESYKGPKLSFPLSSQDVNTLIETFKAKKLLHAKYVLEIFHESRKLFKTKPNLNVASTAISQQITVIGDLHGKFEDLVTIFYKNGLPSKHNPYVFNGDFVDRGLQSIETFVVLLVCVLVWPDAVFLNRGNHEDFSVNIRYGFIKEIMFKYSRHAPRIVQLIDDFYSWLPLGTIIDNKVFVVHGGISDETDLKLVNSLDRHQFITIIRPSPDHDKEFTDQLNQLVDLLWSDPRPHKGCAHNNLRGGGSFFGPDVTEAFLKRHNLQRIIRSHECKFDGHEYTHDGKVLTIFSASNYYDAGSNRGAYAKLFGQNLDLQIVMYVSTVHTKNAKLQPRRCSYVEESALRDLKHQLYASKSLLMEEFQKKDPENKGTITINDWCQCMENVVKLSLPWHLLCHNMVKCEDGQADYSTTFDEYYLTNNMAEEGPSVVESLYRNKDNLEAIFRIMDKDGSGKISMDEFSEACNILSKHTDTSLSQKDIEDLARSIDINKDGFIDFNEFLEAFRLVDRKPSQPSSIDSQKCNGTDIDGVVVKDAST